MPVRGYGMMLMIAFLGGTWWASRRAARVKADPDLVVNLGFVALISSVVGARIFYVIHYWERFQGQGLWSIVNMTAGGLEFYGGFIGAFVACIAFLVWNRVSIRLYADIIAPSLMFGMAAARIGCFLNGCCWGAPAKTNLPWAIQFPYSSPAQWRQWEERMMTLPAELIVFNAMNESYPLPKDMVAAINDKKHQGGERARQQARIFNLSPESLAAMTDSPSVRSLRVHPAQLYASLDGIVLAILLSVIFYRRKRHGVVFGWLLLLYPVCRIVEEIIRIDNPHDTAGLTISQFVSLMILTVGMIWMVAILRMPIRSPLAIPFVSADSEARDAGAAGRKKRHK